MNTKERQFQSRTERNRPDIIAEQED